MANMIIEVIIGLISTDVISKPNSKPRVRYEKSLPKEKRIDVYNPPLMLGCSAEAIYGTRMGVQRAAQEALRLIPSVNPR